MNILFRILCGVQLLCCYAVVAVHLISLTYWCYITWRAKHLPDPPRWPRVAVIKPLKGTMPWLRHNLESFFRQNYPHFELHFCVADASDAAVAVVRDLIEKHPDTTVHLHTSAPNLGVNPKINNIYQAYESTGCDFVWISDASIDAADPSTLKSMVQEFYAGGIDKVGAVHQMPTVVADGTLGTALEQVYFATQHAYVYIYADVSSDCCVNGMSILFRKSALRRCAGGDLSRFAVYLAEDYFMTRSLYDNGLRHRLCSKPSNQRPHYTHVSDVVKRHLRWFRLRRGSLPILTILEPLSESVPTGVMSCLSFPIVFPGVVSSLTYFCLHMAGWFLLDMIMWRIVHQRDAAPLPQAIVGWLLREISGLGMYVVGLRTRIVRWHGHQYIVGKTGHTTLVN